MDRLLITLILIQKYLMKADDSEEEVDYDNISEEVVPESSYSASKQKKRRREQTKKKLTEKSLILNLLISSPPNTTAHLQHMDALSPSISENLIRQSTSFIT
jgi:hypothetical protein